jgi:hypothetical protein
MYADEGTCCLRRQTTLKVEAAYSSEASVNITRPPVSGKTMKTEEAARSPETLVNVYSTARLHVPEALIL